MVALRDFSAFAPRSFEIIDVRPIGSAAFVQTRPCLPSARGFRNILTLGEGLSATWTDILRSEAVEEEYDATGAMKINLRLSGQSTISAAGRSAESIGGTTCSALIQPSGQTKIERFINAVSEKSVTISCTRRHLLEEMGLSAEGLSGPMQDFLSGRPFDFTLFRLAFSPELKRAGEAFFSQMENPFSHRLLIQSRAQDIVRLFFGGLSRNCDVESLRPQDIDLAERCAALMRTHFAAMPSSEAMAASVGASVTRMMRVFKAVRGQTMSDYLNEVRMARAEELIRERRLSVTQIAFDVGYEHPANFSTAFRRHFGLSPRELLAGN